MSNFEFKSVLIIGVGLIGSSICRAIKQNSLSKNIYGLDNNLENIKKCEELSIINKGEDNINNFSEQFDLVIICSPLSTYKFIFKDLSNYIIQDTLITDVGSTKMSVINDFKKQVNNNYLNFVPSHPIAGLEKSGPEYGFAKLFENRFCIITPINNELEIIKN